MKPPLFVLWPALLLGALEMAFGLLVLYALLRVLLHLIALGASPVP